MGITLKGKKMHPYPHGQSGLNSHSQWWQTRAFKGQYGDYDGPCPVQNDPLKVHRIRGILLALTHPLHFDHPPTGFEVIDRLENNHSLLIGYSAFEWTFDLSTSQIK